MSVNPSLVLQPGPWTHRMVAANGSRFHVAIAGDDDGGAPLVLLLHTFPQFWWAWRHVMEPLTEAGYRVAAMDLRGYAASDKPPATYAIPTLAADVRAVIRSLGHRRAVVVGHGLGGQVAWSMPAIATTAVTAIATLASPHPIPAHRRVSAVWTPLALRGLARLQVPWFPERSLVRGDGVAEFLKAAGAGAGLDDPGGIYGQAIQLPFAAHSAVEQIRWWVRFTPRLDGRRYLASVARPIRVPVLRMHGGADPLLKPAGFELDTAYLRGPAKHVIIDGAGHLLPEEAPQQVSSRLIDWLGSLDSLAQ